MGVDGEKIHPRTSRRLLIENAKFLGKEKLYWLTPDFMKTKGIRRIQGRMFRYLKPLNKKYKKILDRYDTWVMHEYPKEVDLQWREQIAKGKYIVLDGMPEFKLDVINENKNNVFAHKKNNGE